MLKFSKKADYGLMAVQYISSVQFGDLRKARVVNTKEIAEEYHIPVELLAKVLQTLARQGIVESQNGPKGGYLLARNAREITIAQVLEAIEGPLGITDCQQEQEDKTMSCSCFNHCNIRTPLLKVQDSIYQLLNNMTVADMTGGTPLITVQSLSTAETGEGVSR